MSTDRREYMKKYRNDPAHKVSAAKYRSEYYIKNKPELQKKQQKYDMEPEHKQRRKILRQLPHNKLRAAVYMKKFSATPEYKEKQLKYARDPNIKQMRKQHRDAPDVKQRNYEITHTHEFQTRKNTRSRSYYNQPRVKQLVFERTALRRRTLGYDVINPEYQNILGFEGHHIDRNHVIFIPRDLHRSVWHSLNKKETMEQINTKVICWLLGVG